MLVRHGQSVRNLAKAGNAYFVDAKTRDSLRGQPDHSSPLTATGLEQARRTGAWLREMYGPFDYVYHSGYQRTIQTADEILSAYSADEQSRTAVRHHLFLREREVGYTFDMTTEEANAAFPWLQEHWETSGRFFARPPGAESLADVAQRVYMFLGMLFRERAGQRILLVCHGGTMRMFRFWLERWTYQEVVDKWETEAIPNCGVLAYGYHPTERRLIREAIRETPSDFAAKKPDR